MKIAFRWAASLLAAVPLLVLGCGLPGPPLPPSLHLATPVKDLTAQRTGDVVTLHWGTPKHTTDHVPLKGPQHVAVCRAAGKGPCAHLAGTQVLPDKPASFEDHLPAELATGDPRPIHYEIEFRNHAGKTAGPSNPAFALAGTAPVPVTGLSAETHAGAILLHWKPAAARAGMVMRLTRTRVEKPGAPKPPESAGSPPPEIQTLEVPLDQGDPGQTLDRDAALNHTYRYQAQRLIQLPSGGQTLEMAGTPSTEVVLEARNTFPPRAPQGLDAVPDPQAGAIDLAWGPNTEPNIAGYMVYRSSGGGSPERVSGDVPLPGPAFHDADVKPGIRYSYFVTAVDADGNASAPSIKIETELPPPES